MEDCQKEMARKMMSALSLHSNIVPGEADTKTRQVDTSNQPNQEVPAKQNVPPMKVIYICSRCCEPIIGPFHFRNNMRVCSQCIFCSRCCEPIIGPFHFRNNMPVCQQCIFRDEIW